MGIILFYWTAQWQALAYNASAAYIYGTDHQRVKEILARTQNGQVKTRTVYQLHPDNAGGLSYEKEQKEDGSIEHRHFIAGSIVLISTNASPSTITSTKYWHKDHLGSVVVITNETGQVLERLAYDPFGKRRYTNGALDEQGRLRSTADRGFTGHEHLDELGFIHMNGRIFDPALGRFLSADPFIQYADNLQSYNRYSYLMNNPLNATDPTGFFKVKSWIRRTSSFGSFVGHPETDMRRGLLLLQVQPGQSRVDRWVASNPLLYSVGQIAVTAVATYFGGPHAGAGASATWASYYAYYQTGDVGAAMKAGAISYASAMMFYGAGQFTASMGWMAQVGAHAVAGCASAAMGGGNCGQGALSAAVAKGVTIGLDIHYKGLGVQKIPFEVGFTAAIVSGGIAEQMGGGKFANGAVTGAFGYLFNYMQEDERRARNVAAGAALGGSAGYVAAGACTAVSGVCGLGTPLIVTGGATLGAALGGFVTDVANWLTNGGAIYNESSPDLPTDIVGNNPKQGSGNRINTDLPGNSEGVFDQLGGGGAVSGPNGSKIAPNGVRWRPGSGSGPRVDIPANGSKPHETIHFPK